MLKMLNTVAAGCGAVLIGLGAMSQVGDLSAPGVAADRGVVQRIAFVELDRWVKIWTYEGIEYFGKVLSEDDNSITLQLERSGIEYPKRFAKRDLTKIEEIENDGGGANAPGQPGGTPRAPEPDPEGGYVVVPMTGEIGEEITLEAFTEVFEDAIKAGVEAVIIDLTSPGGFVTTLDGIHEYLYGSSIAPASKTRVVFYVDGECFSAAALLALCAEELWVADGATIGAAVPLSFNANGVVEVEAKFASAFASAWRAKVDRAGRDGLLADAMIRTETEVWADTAVTPWALHPNDNGQMASPRLLDGKATILSLTGADAVAMGIASRAQSIREVIRGLELENPEREAFRGLEVVKRVRRQQSRALVDFERRVKAIDETFDELVRDLPEPGQGGGRGGGPGGDDGPQLDPKKVIAACTRAIAVAERCKRMLEVSDYLQIAALRRDITIGSIEAAIQRFKDLLEMARDAD